MSRSRVKRLTEQLKDEPREKLIEVIDRLERERDAERERAILISYDGFKPLPWRLNFRQGTVVGATLSEALARMSRLAEWFTPEQLADVAPLPSDERSFRDAPRREALDLIAEWRRGCSSAPPPSPEKCPECTRALIDALERRLAPATAAAPDTASIPIPDDKLVERAVRNARPREPGGTQIRWACVVDAFGLGSTFATRLCKRFGLDPDEPLYAPECPACRERAEEEGE